MDFRITKSNFKPLVWILTIAINGLIAIAILLPKIAVLKRYDFTALPLLNAIMNALTFLSLLIALYAIKQKNVTLHRRAVYLAFLFTSVFLVSYLLYHFSTPSVKYGGAGLWRPVYFFILLTHIVLAAIIVPLALTTIGYGITNQLEKHRKLARWTMPIWLYVSLTGVIVYLMISPYYLK
jgi:putative membrane protein